MHQMSLCFEESTNMANILTSFMDSFLPTGYAIKRFLQGNRYILKASKSNEEGTLFNFHNQAEFGELRNHLMSHGCITIYMPDSYMGNIQIRYGNNGVNTFTLWYAFKRITNYFRMNFELFCLERNFGPYIETITGRRFKVAADGLYDCLRVLDERHPLANVITLNPRIAVFEFGGGLKLLAISIRGFVFRPDIETEIRCDADYYAFFEITYLPRDVYTDFLDALMGEEDRYILETNLGSIRL